MDFRTVKRVYRFRKKIKKAVEKRWSPPPFYYHLGDGGHIEALRRHLENFYFIRLDIKDFFSSVSRNRITRNLKPLFGYKKAREIASESTVFIPRETGNTFALPFGFIQSPLLASISLAESRLGKYLETLYEHAAVEVSVYMDDIIISTKKKELLEEIYIYAKKRAENSLFTLNCEKEEGPSTSVTAFNIKLSHKSLVINDDRMALFIKNYRQARNSHVEDGIYNYVYTVNTKQSGLL